jgi:hypothetical protein
MSHVAWLEALSPWPEDGFGLERMHALLAGLGEPQAGLAAVHVVGTNGKSTTTRMIEGSCVTQARGQAYLSPHVRSGRSASASTAGSTTTRARRCSFRRRTPHRDAVRGPHGGARRLPARRRRSEAIEAASANATTQPCPRRHRVVVLTRITLEPAVPGRRAGDRGGLAVTARLHGHARGSRVGGARARAAGARARRDVGSLAVALAAAGAFVDEPVDGAAAERVLPG